MKDVAINENNIVKKKFITSTKSHLIDWFKKRANAASLWPLIFGDSCCSDQYAQSHLPQYSKKDSVLEFVNLPASISDLLIIIGPINYSLLPEILLEYKQMKDPKWVMAIGGCAINGGPFIDSYNIVSDMDNYIPIDITIPGCPPKPSAIIEGIETLRKCIRNGEFCYE